MPRRQRTRPRTTLAPNSVVASATRYPKKAPVQYRPEQTWQREAYRHYAICGEARYAARYMGRALGRATLHAARIKGDTEVTLTEGAEREYLNKMFAGTDGQSQILETAGVHLTIAGECYIVGRTVTPADDVIPELVGKAEVWEVVSVVEMQVNGSKWWIQRPDGKNNRIELDTSTDLIIRVWLPDPEHAEQADSPFKSMLPVLSEIEYLTKHIFKQVRSRLLGAGVLWMPQGVSFPKPPEVEGAPVPETEADAFMFTLADAMMSSVDDPSAPEAAVPIVAQVPDDLVDKPTLMKFWSDLDEKALEMRKEALHRFAVGMDLPPETIEGMSSNQGTGGGRSNGVSHWGAWQIEESTITMHIEPMLDVICNALTVMYMRPGLDQSDVKVIYNTARLRLRPDRSKEAFELWDRGALSTEALLRETGFGVEDIPDEAEFKRWLTIKVASGSATPDQVAAALAALGVDLGTPTMEEPRESRPAPSLEDHPVRPRTPDEALLAASEALVFRALERAGNRLRQGVAKVPGVPSYETHIYVKANGSTDRLLEDAWSCAPQVLDGLADPDRVIPVLNAYCTALLVEQSGHSRDRLAKFLSTQPARSVA